MLPVEPGVVYGEAATVHLWPAAALDLPDRSPHFTGPERPLRCQEMDQAFVYVLYATGHERTYVDGEPRAWDLMGLSREALYAHARRRLIDAALQGHSLRGVTYLIGPCSSRERRRWGSAWFDYPVVPVS